MKKNITAFVLCCPALFAQGAQDFVWKAGERLAVACEQAEAPTVHVALDLLKRDSESVLSESFSIEETTGDIYVGTWGKSRLLQRLAEREQVDFSELEAHPEAFLLDVLPDGRLLVAGSDKRGTAYGLMEVSRLLGVSPWEWWADAVPAPKEELRIAAGFRKVAYPSVAYRGIFINDEDWGFMPWSGKNHEPSDIEGQIGPKTHERVFELLLRLRANTFWPAMHECSVPFFFTPGNKEVADRYGIYLGSSHCEPMMRNTNGEWRKAGKGEYNYPANGENVLAFWEERVRQLQHSDGIYTLGMRGIHDSGMLGAETVDERKAVLAQVLEDQRRLLARYKNRDVARVPQVFIPYKEVLDVYNAGLQVPEDVTLMWCDDNYGYITHFPTAEEAARPGGNGIYYHISYWGRPHDYLWLSTASPYLVYQQMKTAYDKGIRKMWILNVGDIKPAEYQIELFMDMAWDIRQVEQAGVTEHLNRFLAREFGNTAASYLLPMMREHYRLAYIRKPEFMGHTRTEEKDPAYKVVGDLPWSEPYIRTRLEDYGKIERQAATWGMRVPPERRKTYFQLVQYPIQAAAQMNRKCLYAQLARHGKAGWQQSRAAYDSIVALTRAYNDEKWQGIMDYKPRDLPVFQPIPPTTATGPLPLERPFLCKWNAWEATGGHPQLHEGLGYEGMAAGIAKGETVSFRFEAGGTDSVEVELRFVPTHPIDGKDLRIRLSLDGLSTDAISYRTYGRSEEWKLNVLSNQAVRRIVLPLPPSGLHTLGIEALDEGVVLDQVLVRQRPFHHQTSTNIYHQTLSCPIL